MSSFDDSGFHEKQCLLTCFDNSESYDVTTTPTTTTVRREIGLTSAVALTVGSIIGSGIFVTPKGVILESGSVGMALVVWMVCGVFSMVGALCYAELGLMFEKSGCDFIYIRSMFGELLSFLILWSAVLVEPVGKVVSALICANYALEPIFLGCEPPHNAARLMSIAIIGLVTYVNCRNVQWVTRMQNVFTSLKVLALVVIIVAGMWQLAMGNTQNFDNLFEGTTKSIGRLSLSMYSGLYAYSGWNCLNFVIEEVKEPKKTFPRAIYISVPLVAIVYVSTNVAYFTVLTPQEIISSNAVAVTFGDRELGVMSWTIPVFVAISTFGGINSGTFAASRLLHSAAREGQLPSILSMININCFTPIPSLTFLFFLSLLYLSTTSVGFLINCGLVVNSLSNAASVAGLIWWRIKKPDLKRPVKVPIVLALPYLAMCIFLVIVPVYTRPWDTCLGVGIALSALPVYFVAIKQKYDSKTYSKVSAKFTEFIQKLTLSVAEEKCE